MKPEQVFKIVQSIPEGMVMTYGQIAKLCGNPRASRAVGWALHRNPDPGVTPCHRVVFKDGGLCSGYVFGGRGVQKQRLVAEGVKFLDEFTVDMEQCCV
jgi:methylated-DNA-protein-cysteine methyltransferase-like protein